MDRLNLSLCGRPLSLACTLLHLVAPPLLCAQAAGAASSTNATPNDDEVSLEQLLRFAERNAPALQVAARRRAYADATRAGASPLLRSNPTLELAAGPRFDGGGDGTYDLRASLEQPVEIAGQRSARIEVAERLRNRLDRDADATRWALRRQVVLTYRIGVVARERVAAAETLVHFADEMLTIARRRYATGDIGRIHVHLAETDAAQAQQARLLADQELQSARFSLCEMTGWPVASPPLPRAGLSPLADIPTLENAIAIARRQHPELLARRAALAEANAEVELEDREAWPTPSFGVEVAREGNLLDRTNYVLLGTISLPLPFWQRNQGARASARAEAGVVHAEEHAAAAALVARVARAHSELRSAAKRVRLFTTSVTAPLESTLLLLRKGFDAGEIPIFEVALVRERFLAATRDGLSAYLDYYRALAEFENAVGADIAVDPAAPAAPR